MWMCCCILSASIFEMVVRSVITHRSIFHPTSLRQSNMSIAVSNIQHAQAVELKDHMRDKSSGSRSLLTPDIEEAQTDEFPPDGGVKAWVLQTRLVLRAKC